MRKWEELIIQSNWLIKGLFFIFYIFRNFFRIHNLIEDGTLFIGLGISHPGALGNYERARGAAPNVPSVIGVCL